ncbi:MAG: CDC27 family protein [Sulfurospirillum sp.]
MTDRAFEDLQKRCKKMGIKKFMKIVLSVFLLFLTVIFLCFVYIKINSIEPKKSVIRQKKVKIIKKNVSSTTLKQEKSFKPKNIPKIKIPQKEKKDDYNTVILKPTIIIPKIKTSQMQQVQNLKPKIVKKIEPEKKVQKERKKIIIQVRSLRDEASLLKENKTSESFQSTLNLSEYYLKKSKYEKAINWSKKANHYKPSSFKPWLIYAKAKIKQGKKSEAAKAVETFLSYFSSPDAQKFLYEIKGKK